MEYDNRYATNGKGNAALATGIIGTAGVGLSLLGGLNGLLGAPRAVVPQCGEDAFVSRYDLQREQELAAKDSEIALLKANTYNDQKSLEMYKYVDGRLREIEARLGEQAVINQRTADSFALVQQDIKMEAEKRCCGDNSIVNYANATFYPKMIANVTTGTDTTAQTLYNPIPKCGDSCGK